MPLFKQRVLPLQDFFLNTCGEAYVGLVNYVPWPDQTDLDIKRESFVIVRI